MAGSASGPEQELNLRVDDIVEVRTRKEILRTLDATGALDGLPFMPEMLKYCGRQFRVFKRADKTCDTIEKTGARRMLHAVHLEGLRCDGEAHGGCQAGCLLFWKEAWLKRVEGGRETKAGVGDEQPAPGPGHGGRPGWVGGCTEELLTRATRRAETAAGAGNEGFVCQATELRRATSPLAWWDVCQYVRDVRSRNVGLSEVLRGLTIRGVLNLLEKVQHWPGGFRLQTLLGGRGRGLWQIPQVAGTLARTPREVLNLKPGERVRVKSKEEVARTLDVHDKNRGLSFDVEMLKYCGGEFTVLRRVERIIDERTGRMRTLPNECIILEGVTCGAHFSERRLFCPRRIYSYWREIWLTRLESDRQVSAGIRGSDRAGTVSPEVTGPRSGRCVMRRFNEGGCAGGETAEEGSGA